MTDRTYAGDLGARLRERRRQLGLTQADVADLADTTQRTVSQVEAGHASGVRLYLAVAEVLGLEVVLEPRERSWSQHGADAGVP